MPVQMELACLGAALKDPNAADAVSKLLQPDDFSSDANREVWRCISECRSHQMTVDRMVVYQGAVERGVHHLVTGAVLLDAEEACVSPGNVALYVQAVRHNAQRRHTERLIRQALARMEGEDSADDICADLTRDLADIGQSVERSYAAASIGSILTQWAKSVDDGPPKRVPTPFPGLNYFLDGGFGPGEMIYLGARPRIGKSACAVEMARCAAASGVPTLIVSREMYRMVIGRWLVAQTTGIPSRHLKRGLLDPSEWKTFQDAYGKMSGLPLWVTDELVTLKEIDAMVDRWSGEPLGLVIVDYLQLVGAPKGVTDRRHQVEAVSAGLKGIAMRKQIPLLCLSSLNRPSNAYQETEPRPTLASLKESGNLEHDADIVLFLHREHPDTDSQTELIVAKQKDGPTGTVTLNLTRETVSLREEDHG